MGKLQLFFVNTFNNNTWLAVILFAMLPVTEARLAIPFGLSKNLWGSSVLSPIYAFLFGVIGSFLPCAFIIIFLKPIFNILKNTRVFRKLIASLENLAHKKSKSISKSHSEIKKYFLLTLFVAIPLPLTGVWTGSLIASISNLSVWKSTLSIFIGNIIAGILITIISIMFDGNTEILIVLLFSIIGIYLLFTICKKLIERKRKLKYKPIIY